LRYFTLFAFVAVLTALPDIASAADTCALISRADVSTLLGQPALAGAATGPAKDEDSSGQLSYCTYRAGTAALIVSVVEFSSAAEAKKTLTLNLVKGRMNEDAAKVTEEPGIGERSFYALSGRLGYRGIRSSEGRGEGFIKGPLDRCRRETLRTYSPSTRLSVGSNLIRIREHV